MATKKKKNPYEEYGLRSAGLSSGEREYKTSNPYEEYGQSQTQRERDPSLVWDWNEKRKEVAQSVVEAKKNTEQKPEERKRSIFEKIGDKFEANSPEDKAKRLAEGKPEMYQDEPGKGYKNIAERVGDIFEANSPQDKAKRAEAGQPETYQIQQGQKKEAIDRNNTLNYAKDEVDARRDYFARNGVDIDKMLDEQRRYDEFKAKYKGQSAAKLALEKNPEFEAAQEFEKNFNRYLGVEKRFRDSVEAQQPQGTLEQASKSFQRGLAEQIAKFPGSARTLGAGALDVVAPEGSRVDKFAQGQYEAGKGNIEGVEQKIVDAGYGASEQDNQFVSNLSSGFGSLASSLFLGGLGNGGKVSEATGWLAKARAALNPGIPGAVFGANAGADQYIGAIDAGKSDFQAFATAIVGGAAEGYLEKLGVDKFLGAEGTVIKKFLTRAISEGLQEASQSFSQSAVSSTYTSVDFSDALMQALEEGGYGALIGGGSSLSLSLAEKMMAKGVPEDVARDTAEKVAGKIEQAAEEELPPPDGDAIVGLLNDDGTPVDGQPTDLPTDGDSIVKALQDEGGGAEAPLTPNALPKNSDGTTKLPTDGDEVIKQLQGDTKTQSGNTVTVKDRELFGNNAHLVVDATLEYIDRMDKGDVEGASSVLSRLIELPDFATNEALSERVKKLKELKPKEVVQPTGVPDNGDAIIKELQGGDYAEGQSVKFDKKDWTIGGTVQTEGDTKYKLVDANGRELWTNKEGLDSANGQSPKDTFIKTMEAQLEGTGLEGEASKTWGDRDFTQKQGDTETLYGTFNESEIEDTAKAEEWKQRIEAGERPTVLTVTEDGTERVVDGRHKLWAYRELGIKEVPVVNAGEKPRKKGSMKPLGGKKELQSRAAAIYSRIAQQAKDKNIKAQNTELASHPTRYHQIYEDENPKGIKIGDEVRVRNAKFGDRIGTVVTVQKETAKGYRGGFSVHVVSPNYYGGFSSIDDVDVISSTTPTQKDIVASAVKDQPKDIKAIADETGIKEPNIRRILGVGAKDGTFERVDKGVYRLRVDGQDIAYVETASAVEALPRLAKDGFKADMIFLDIPYDTPAVKGGNRGANYNLISVDDFGTVLSSIKKIVRDTNTPVIHMYSNAKSGMAKMQQYNDVFITQGFVPVGKGEYQKTYKDGSPVGFPTSAGFKITEPEGILVFTLSGELDKELKNLNYKLVRPKGYQTEKPANMLKDLIEMTTEEGDTVLDPFAGSGVTGAEAAKSGRKSYSIEVDPRVADEVTKPRIEDATKKRIKEIRQAQKEFAGKDGLTDEEAAEFEKLGKELSDIQFDTGKPAKTEDVLDDSETMSTLSPEVVVAAYEDIMSNRGAFDAIKQAARGVYFGSNTAVDDIMDGKSSMKAAELYRVFDGTRQALRRQFGDTITLYRATGKQKKKYTTNWATTKEFAEQFGDDVIKKVVPIDDVVAVHVSRDGRYHEIIVGKNPTVKKKGAVEPLGKKPTKPTEVITFDENNKEVGRRWEVVYPDGRVEVVPAPKKKGDVKPLGIYDRGSRFYADTTKVTKEEYIAERLTGIGEQRVGNKKLLSGMYNDLVRKQQPKKGAVKPLKKNPRLEALIDDYADMIRGMEEGLSGGDLISDGEGGYKRTTEHTKFYREFYAENKRKPNKAEWREEAIRQLESGKAPYGASEDYQDVKQGLKPRSGIDYSKPNPFSQMNKIVEDDSSKSERVHGVTRTKEELIKLAQDLNKAGQSNAMLRRGGSKSKKALGSFQSGGRLKGKERIMLQDAVILDPAQYVSTLAHELSHASEFQVNGNTRETYKLFGEITPDEKKQIQKELQDLVLWLEGPEVVNSDPKYYNRPTEQLARYVQVRFLDKAQAVALAPLVHEKYDMAVERHEELKNLIDALEGELDKGFRNKTPDWFRDLRQTYQKWLGKRAGDNAYDAEIVRRARIQHWKKNIGQLIKQKFKNVKDDPEALFKAAEAIKQTDEDGNLVYGTRDIQIAQTVQEIKDFRKNGWEFVKTRLTKEGKEEAVMAKQRYTEEEGKAMFDALTPEGQQLVRDFVANRKDAKDFFNREVIKDVFKIESELEGWVHRGLREEVGLGERIKGRMSMRGKKTSLKSQKASAKKQRGTSESYLADFQKQMEKALLELGEADINNQFIIKQLARISKPIAKGQMPDLGWVEVTADFKRGLLLPGEGGRDTVEIDKEDEMTGERIKSKFMRPQARYQVPANLAKHYRQIREVPEEMSKTKKIMMAVNKYWAINVLLHGGTVGTNFIGGGIQYSTKIMNDFYAELIIGKVTMPQTRRNVTAMLQVLLPHGWSNAPDYVYGGHRSNYAGQFMNQSKTENLIDKAGDIGLTPFSLVESYWKKVIMLSEQGDKLPKKELQTEMIEFSDMEAKMIAELNKEVDLYAFDYDNVPNWLDSWGRAGGGLIKPFMKYPYKYSKLVTNLATGAFDRTLPVNERAAKILTLSTMMALSLALMAWRDDEKETPEGTEKTPGSLNSRGRLFAWADDGKELFVRTAKYPFINIASIGKDLVQGDFSQASDIITDQIGSIGPVADMLFTRLGYRNKFEQYTPEDALIGQQVAAFIPGFRILNDIGRIIDTTSRRPENFIQGIGSTLPIWGSEETKQKYRGDARTVKIPDEPEEGRSIASSSTTEREIKLYNSDIILSALTGIYITRIDPKEAKQQQLREQRNDAEQRIRALLKDGKETEAAKIGEEAGLSIPKGTYDYYRRLREKSNQ